MPMAEVREPGAKCSTGQGRPYYSKRGAKKKERKRKREYYNQIEGYQGRKKRDTNKPELPKGNIRAPAYASLRDSIGLGLGSIVKRL
jgi:hypothetical protein